jgi:predicted TIM-barrel fold metal-dependent hydrolase
MDAHGIDISILSLGNPWLDFVEPEHAAAEAARMNDATNEICAGAGGRLFFFAALPLTGGVSDVLAEIERLRTLSHVRGIVTGTHGFGGGLDDPGFLPVYRALAQASLPIFLHPNYGLPGEIWGPCCADYGQVLQVSLGFTMETTIAITRLILSGVFEEVPTLQVVLSHAGGTLPFLAGRIESCVGHDAHWKAQGKLREGRQTVWHVLKTNIYLDGAIYHQVGLKAAVEASGVERVMFGTDHPFFPPPDGGVIWQSVTSNEEAVKAAYGDGREYAMIMGGNAMKAFNLKE